MKSQDSLYYIALAVFYFMALIAIWHQLASSDYRFLTDLGLKIWSMAALALYGIILLEKHKRKKD